MKLGNIKLPAFSWSADWGSALSWKLTQIITSFTYIINQHEDGYLYPTKSVTATYNANVGDTIILADGTFTVTLPAANKCKNKRFTVKNSGAGTITLDAATGNIDGVATKSIATTVSVDVACDGTNYWII